MDQKYELFMRGYGECDKIRHTKRKHEIRPTHNIKDRVVQLLAINDYNYGIPSTRIDIYTYMYILT